MVTSISDSLVIRKGDVLMYGPGMMREERWKWTSPPQNTLVLRTKDDNAACVLRTFLRMLVSDTRVFRAIGIGGVYTKPECRGQGCATQLLGEAIEWMRMTYQSADVVVMYSRPRELYTRFGFKVLDGALLGRALHDDVLIGQGSWHTQPEDFF